MRCYMVLYDVSGGHITSHNVVFYGGTQGECLKAKLFSSAKQGQGQYISQESIISKFIS